MSTSQEALEELNELHADDKTGQLVSRAADLTADFILHALADALGATTWTACDGTETWNGDVLGTMRAILTDGGVFDAETDESAMAKLSRVEAERDAAFRRGWEAGREAAAALCEARAAVVNAVFPADEETRLVDRAQGAVSALQTTAAELRALTPPGAAP